MRKVGWNLVFGIYPGDYSRGLPGTEGSADPMDRGDRRGRRGMATKEKLERDMNEPETCSKGLDARDLLQGT